MTHESGLNQISYASGFLVDCDIIIESDYIKIALIRKKNNMFICVLLGEYTLWL